MKEFKWRELLTNHSIFGGVATKEVERIIDQLLDQKVSTEREYANRTIIVREGELGDSVFFVGSGIVEVLLPGREDHETCVAVLKQGEFFGEMALIEKKPRTATVRAIEDSVLLEIKGQEFLKLLDEHRDVESKMLLKLCERLRHANDEIIAVKLKGVDEKLKLFNEKVDAELKKFGAFVTEAGAMANQTKSRADDIINSFERTRTWLTWLVSFVISIITLGGLVGGGALYFNFKSFNEHFEKQLAEAKEKVNSIRTFEEEMKTIQLAMQQKTKQIEDQTKQIRQNLVDQIMPEFLKALQKDVASQVYSYEQLLESNPDLELTAPLSYIETEIAKDKRRDFTTLLLRILHDAKRPKEKMTAYYLLLTNAILIDKKEFPNQETFVSTLADFEKYVQKNRPDTEKLPDLRNVFRNENGSKLKEFQRVNKIIHRS